MQPVFSQPDFADLDALLTRNEKQLGGNVVALIYKDGKIIHTKQIGQDFTVKTQAPIANAGQWMTAALIMSLVDEGKLSLEDPVMKYIPIFAQYSKKYITIRNCLSHTTGIQSDHSLLPHKKSGTLEDEATSFAKKEIDRNPGEIFVFSNIGFNIAGRIAEIVTKKSFDRLVQDRIIRPLKMRQTTFYLDFDKAIDPSGGAWSSANDYLSFLVMLLNKGTFEGKRILSEKSVEEMEKMQTGQAAIKFTPKMGEGLGLRVRRLDTRQRCQRQSNRSRQPEPVWHLSLHRLLPGLCRYHFCKNTAARTEKGIVPVAEGCDRPADTEHM